MNKLLGIHGSYGVNFVKGDGLYLFDEKGDKHLDFHGGIAVNILGYGDSDLKKSIIQQINTGLFNLSKSFPHKQSAKLADKLCNLTFAEKVYFLNSGTESVEMAIKVCRKYYHQNKKLKIKNKKSNLFENDINIPHIISFKKSFHGRTLGSMSLQQRYTENFEPALSGFSQANINDIQSVISEIRSNTAAIFIEPIQGEGGVIPCTKDFLKDVKDLCVKNDILLVFDEIQTGIGRTGYFYAYQYFGVEPDILLSSKALGGGFPISAILFNKKTSNIMNIGDHGTTLGGNIISSTAANIVVEKVSNADNLKYIREIGQYLKLSLNKALKENKGVLYIRGMGLIVGIELDPNLVEISKVKEALKEKKLLVVLATNIIRLLPCMKISKKEVDITVKIVAESINLASN